MLHPKLPALAGLLRDIEAGTCIAFVGSGFSAPGGVPTWVQLLRRLLARLPAEQADVARWAMSVLDGRAPSAHELDRVAQVLEDSLGEDRFEAELTAAVTGAPGGDRMARRQALLRGIPFKAILTTNYDAFLPARPTVPAPREVLRTPIRSWYERVLQATRAEWNTPILKLHGDIESAANKPVLTRRAYRDLLYGGGTHLGFVRSVLASHTMLYLGFSFADAYLNELRSEVLSYLDGRETPRNAEPLAYAFLESKTLQEQTYFRRHEGVEVVSYSPADDHAEFDELLQALHDATNPAVEFGRRLGRLRVLWVDPSPRNNEVQHQALAAICRMEATQARIDDEPNHMRALEVAYGYDLIISNWGTWDDAVLQRPHDAPGPWLMTRLHERRIDVPVVVFAADQRRAGEAVRAGVFAYTTRTEDLFEALARAADALCDETRAAGPAKPLPPSPSGLPAAS